MLGGQSEPRAQPCTPRLGRHCRAGVRGRGKANLSHSQTQSRLLLVSSMTERGQQPCSEESSGRGLCGNADAADLPPLVPLLHTLQWYQGLVLSVLEGKCRADTSKCCSGVLSGAAVALPVLQTAAQREDE